MYYISFPVIIKVWVLSFHKIFVYFKILKVNPHDTRVHFLFYCVCYQSRPLLTKGNERLLLIFFFLFYFYFFSLVFLFYSIDAYLSNLTHHPQVIACIVITIQTFQYFFFLFRTYFRLNTHLIFAWHSHNFILN